MCGVVVCPAGRSHIWNAACDPLCLCLFLNCLPASLPLPISIYIDRFIFVRTPVCFLKISFLFVLLSPYFSLPLSLSLILQLKFSLHANFSFKCMQIIWLLFTCAELRTNFPLFALSPKAIILLYGLVLHHIGHPYERKASKGSASARYFKDGRKVEYRDFWFCMFNIFVFQIAK